MAKSRSSKGFLQPPVEVPNYSAERRQKWLEEAANGFVGSAANKAYYRLILEMLWPAGHGIPGPHVSQNELRTAIDAARTLEKKEPYVDPFRRMRELQGEEGFTSIMKEGIKYQLQSLDVAQKRQPRAKPMAAIWEKIRKDAGFRCSHCGQQEPAIKLSPDHRVPRSRGGTNDDENWQPLCEQCNNQKSSVCQGCSQNCLTCAWAYPEIHKSILIEDDNKALIRRAAEKQSVNQSDLVNQVLRDYFNSRK